MDDGPNDDRRPPAPAAGAPRVLGRVIKSDSSDSTGGDRPSLGGVRRAGVVNAEEYDARQTAKDIIAKAQEQATQILAEARRKKEEEFAKARDEAKADVQARSAEELARAKLQAGQVLAESEKDIIELALRVAAKIIGSDLERSPELVVDICANAIQNVRSQKAMILKVHPEDGKLLRDKKPRLMEQIGRALDVAVRDDPDIERGGCIIQTEFGTIDAQIRTQLQMLQVVLVPDTSRKEVK